MKKTLILTFLVVAGILFLAESGILNSLLYFLLVGAVPGTSYSIPSGIMLLMMVTIIWMVIFKLASLKTLYSITTGKLNKQHTDRKKHLPSRRYNQI